jgi:hypothetical protein
MDTTIAAIGNILVNPFECLSYPEEVFGPLNGVRAALVTGAFIAAIVAFIIGQALVGWILLAAVSIHGLGWLYLYRQH